MICPECHTDNIPGADFCESCGHDLLDLDIPGAEDAFTTHLLHDTLGELDVKRCLSLSPGDPVALAIHAMQRDRTECVLVKDNAHLVGILTEYDILLKAAGDKVDLNAITVGQVMTPDPVVLRDEETLAVALHKMSVGEFRHIPLLQQGHAERVVSIQDVFHHISAFIHEELAPAS